MNRILQSSSNISLVTIIASAQVVTVHVVLTPSVDVVVGDIVAPATSTASTQASNTSTWKTQVYPSRISIDDAVRSGKGSSRVDGCIKISRKRP